MGYLSCNGERAIAACDPYNWDCKRISASTPAKPGKPAEPAKIRKFSYPELLKATNGFSADSFLGKGSQGSVYRAVLDDGKLIAAVKRAKLSNPSSIGPFVNSSNNANTSPAENELEILSRVQSPRLVNLIGFCDDSNVDRLHLVVEYMPKGSLYDLLHKSTKPPGWTRRVRFALQVAKAVQCLHSLSPPIIHRDIKSSNVLIDKKSNARLSDFGLALRGHVEDVRVKCTPPAGTLGYLDPCYLAPSDLSAKSDVFSFGILLLEIVTGRNAIDVNFSPPSIVDWAGPLIERHAFESICDRRIGLPEDPVVIPQIAVLAARCVRGDARRRPEMVEVVERLKAVSKRARALRPPWGNLRRHVEWRSMEALASEEVAGGGGGGGGSGEEMVNTRKLGSGRRNRKVASIPNVGDCGNEGHGAWETGYKSDSHAAAVRSRSVGSHEEMIYCRSRRKATASSSRAAAKWAVMGQLSRSRSTGGVRGSGVGDNKLVSLEGESGRSLICEGSASFEEGSERKLLEKPLFPM